MNILQLCHKPPFPPSDGGTIAMNNVTQGLLQAGHRVKVLAIETPKHRVNQENITDEYKNAVQFESVYVDTSIAFLPALKTVFNRQSYQVSRFFSKNFAKKLVEVLQQQQFDIVQLESVFMAPYISIIRQNSDAKIVLRTHNIEHQIWQRVAKNEPVFPKKWAIKYFANQLERFECGLGNKVDAFAAISEPDFQFFSNYFKIPGTILHFGINIDDYAENEDYIPSDTPELFHVGSMNWKPNIEGIEFFLDEVWPLLLERFPQLTFTIAGRGIPHNIAERSDKNVEIVGEVPSANDFILSKDIMVVPLLSGSGVRVKIIEGMALGKTVITTSIGAEGLAVENGKNILIANTPEEFVDAIAKCVHTPDICAILGENARNFVALNHNNERITQELILFYNSLIHNANV
ncbi:MAG: glycosyltransferase family 4 protein [Bacteroidales bacterium]|nr:glycosyltransferase family 4 protein [Bacteroidales bacterium]